MGYYRLILFISIITLSYKRQGKKTESFLRNFWTELGLYISAFIHGMRGEAGKQLRFSMPGTEEEALRISELIQRTVEMENKEEKKKLFSFLAEKMKCFNCGKIGHMKRDCRSLWKDSPKQNYARSALRRQPTSRKPPESDERKSVNVKTAVTCWRCNKPGHVEKQCRKQLTETQRGNPGNLN